MVLLRAIPIRPAYVILWPVFMWSPYPRSLIEITPVSTTFCGDYPCEYYFLWRLSLWTLLFVEIIPVCTTFCGDYPYEHYFLWRLSLCALRFGRLSPCALILCSRTHYDITKNNGTARNIHCDHIMGHDCKLQREHTMTS